MGVYCLVVERYQGGCANKGTVKLLLIEFLLSYLIADFIAQTVFLVRLTTQKQK